MPDTLAMPAADDTRFTVPVPRDWVPVDAVVMILGLYDQESERWQALMPQFGLGGQGTTFEEAREDARQLLVDYLETCFREGRTFEQSYRPAGFRLLIGEFLRTVGVWVRAKVRHRVGVRRERLHLVAA